MYFLLLGLSYQEFVKHYRGDLFICDISDPAYPERILNSCGSSSPTRWTFDQNEDGQTVVHTPRDKTVWDVGANNFLKTYPLHGKKNQLFKFEALADNKYQIRSQNKCIEFDPAEHKYTLEECSMKYEQMFTIHDELPLKPTEDLIGTHHFHDDFIESHVNTPFDREGKVYHFTCDKNHGYHHRGHTDHHDDVLHTTHRGHH